MEIKSTVDKILKVLYNRVFINGGEEDMSEQQEVTDFDVQLNDHPEVKELRKKLSGELKQLSSTVALLAGKISEVWPTIEGAEVVPPIPMIVYQIAETLKQDMCVLAMDEIDPGWEDRAKASIDAVLDIIKGMVDESEEPNRTIH